MFQWHVLPWRNAFVFAAVVRTARTHIHASPCSPVTASAPCAAKSPVLQVLVHLPPPATSGGPIAEFLTEPTAGPAAADGRVAPEAATAPVDAALIDRLTNR